MFRNLANKRSRRTKFVMAFCITSLAFSSQEALATIAINNEITVPQLISLPTNSTLEVSGDGNLLVDTTVAVGPIGFEVTRAAVYTTGLVGLGAINVNVGTNGSSTGIRATGGAHGAIEIGGADSLAGVNLTAGIITSDKSGDATIALTGVGTTTAISASAGTTLSNSATSGMAINSTTDSDTALSVSNAGTISAANHADSIAINVGDSDGGSSLTVENTGVLSAGASGTAISVNNSGNSLSLSNTSAGAITGAISVLANDATIVNNSSGAITGAISSTTGGLSVTNTAGNIVGNISTSSGDLDVAVNAGSVTGNITLGSNAGSSVAIAGGSVVGNIAMNNSSQITNLSGGSLVGNINGSGRLEIDSSSTLIGHVGNVTQVTTLAINAGNTLNAATYDISARTVDIKSEGELALNGGTLSASVQGNSDGVGTLTLLQNFTAAGDIGSADNSLARVFVATGKTLNMAATGSGLDAVAIDLGSGSSLTVGVGVLAGVVDGLAASNGTINFTGANTTESGTQLGSVNGLAAINIANGATVVSGDSIKALTTTVGGGISGSLSIASNKSVTGEVLIRDGGTFTLGNGSSVSGAINGSASGAGSLVIADNATVATSSNIGSTHALSSLTLNYGSTLDAATANSNISATMISIDIAATLSIGSGTISGTIRSVADGSGSISFADSRTLSGNIGDEDHSLLSMTIAANKTINAGSYNIDVADTLLASGATLVLGSGSIVGTVRGATDGVGTLSITNNVAAGIDIGSNDQALAAVSIAAGKTLNLGNNLHLVATSTTLGSGSVINADSAVIDSAIDGISAYTGTLNLDSSSIASTASVGLVNGLDAININSGSGNFGDSIKANTIRIGSSNTSGLLTIAANKSITGAILMNNSSSLTLNSNSSIVGTVNGSSAGVGSIEISTGTVSTNTNIGSVAALNLIAISSDATLNIATNNNTLSASIVRLKSNATLSVGTGAVTGTIRGRSDNQGIVSFTQNYTSAGDIGVAGGSLQEVAVAAGKTLDLSVNNNSIVATDITLGTNATLTLGTGAITGNLAIGGGTLNLGSSTAFDGDIVGSGSSTINLGSSAHTNTGNLVLNANDTLKVSLASASVAGSLASAGAASTSANTNLQITVAGSVGYISSQTSYTIVSGGAGSSITAIGNSKINVNSSGSNKIGLMTFSTAQLGDNLVLNVSKESAAAISSNHSEQNAFGAIDQAVAVSGELQAMQNYIIVADINNEQRQTALQSITPNDTGLNKNTFDLAGASIRTSENRLETLRDINRLDSRDSQVSGYKIINRRGVEVAQGDNVLYASAKNNSIKTDAIGNYNSEAVNKGIWAQVFGTSAKQANKAGFNGYNSVSSGVAFGADSKIDKNTTAGLSLSIANSRVKSFDALKTTDVNSYQVNIYGGKNFDKYFIDAIAGVSFNRYDSTRVIPLVGKAAKASYDGQTYSVKAKTGFIEKFGEHFELIPEIGAIYARNHVNNYQESGAGTLGLQIRSRDANFFEGTAGIGVAYNSIKYRDVDIYPKLKFIYGYDFIGNKQTATSNFIGQVATFDSQSSKINRRSFKIDGGINIYTLRNVTVSANYILEKKKTYESHSGLAKVRWEF